MVGEFGDVHLLDWGLATLLTHTEKPNKRQSSGIVNKRVRCIAMNNCRPSWSGSLSSARL